MIGENEQVVMLIHEFIAYKKEKNGIINEVIRDDVFDILKEECVVLYYALDDSRSWRAGYGSMGLYLL